MTAVLHAAAPPRQEDVENYLHSVAEQLRACPVIGDGNVYRAAEAAQKKHFEPPVLYGAGVVIKYGR